jgi:predicted nucleotidyltransferase/predicted transcriptional regulator
METILKPGVEKIMKLFYENKRENFHLREIARRTNMNENNASKILYRLEKDNILVSRKDGNLKKFSINPKDRIFSIFSYFDIEKLNSLDILRKKALDYFINKLEEKPFIALIFGSTAKGTTRKDSDIDLLLIVNTKIKTGQAEKYAEAQTGVKISVFQINYNDFKLELKTRYDKVLDSAVNTGFPILNNVQYYREVYR